MKLSIIPESVTREQYNTVANHPLQTWEWGEARAKMGTEIIRLGAYEGDTLAQTFLMTLHPIPHTSFKVGYIPRSVVPSVEVLEQILQIARDRKIIFVKWEPDAIKNASSTSSIESFSSGVPIVHSSHPLFPTWTMKLDLTAPEDDLMANLKQKTRYNIRLAAKKGVTVAPENTDSGFETFIKLYFDTCKRQHYFGHNREYHQIVWDTLKGSLAQILVARFENEPLGAYELFYFKNTLYYPYGGSSELQRSVMAPNLLMWEAIRLGKQLGATSFDMWGSSAPSADPNNAYAGFTRFKEGYNAQFVEMIGSYDLVVNRAMYKIYSTMHYLRTMYLEMKAR